MKKFFCLALVLVFHGAGVPHGLAAPALAADHANWKKVSAAFDAYFAQLKGYHRQKLITQTDVSPLWTHLAAAGWSVSPQERVAIMKKIPVSGEFMVRQLHTSAGLRFMRNVAPQYPEVYDRLDRLCHTPGGGRPAASGLIAAPDALLTVKYMFSEAGERSWASLMQDKKLFNQPTGRIYTAESLKTELETLFTQGPNSLVSGI